jgi:hypothetical protein
MPPPGVRGSAFGELKVVDGLSLCEEKRLSELRGTATEAFELAKACTPTMAAKGSLVRGAVKDSAPAFTFQFAAEAGKCYRVHVAALSSVKSLGVTLRDSQGGTMADESNSAPTFEGAPPMALGVRAPALGMFCASKADTVTVLIASGSGDGAISAQIFAQ